MRIISIIRHYDTAKIFLPNTKIITDRFHVARYCIEAIENIRRGFQKTLLQGAAEAFQVSRGLPLAHLDQPLQAYALKEVFYDFMTALDRDAVKRLRLQLQNLQRLQGKDSAYRKGSLLLISLNPAITKLRKREHAFAALQYSILPMRGARASFSGAPCVRRRIPRRCTARPVRRKAARRPAHP